jgi:hypothetical protein
MPSIHLSGNTNITFVHVPKSAGSSIGEWLKIHNHARQLSEWYEHPKLETMTTEPTWSFAVVRNPWDRTVSFYHFLKNIHEMYKNKEPYPPFDSWVENLEDFKLTSTWWFTPATPQVEWTHNVDLVLKYENLSTEFKQIQDMFESTDPLPNLMITQHNHYTTYYNSTTENIIANIFSKDIEAFGY